MAYINIREYRISYDPGDTDIAVYTHPDYKTATTLSAVPTKEESNKAFGTNDLPLAIKSTFWNCTGLIAAPRLPKQAIVGSLSGYGLFEACTALVVSPMLPAPISGTSGRLLNAFDGCTSLIQGPVIPQGIINIGEMFLSASALETPVSLPPAVERTYSMFRDAVNISGEMIIRPASLSNYTGMFEGTTKPITLYGDKTLCEALAATADNANVSWSAWYDPVEAVTDRGQGSFTTAADMTRMVRNGALAVSSYAPGRMVYQQGDIVRADEWNALVEAAQTIDPTVTYSTNYANLNKIEAAFDSAL